MRERNLRRSTWLVVMALLAVAALAVWRASHETSLRERIRAREDLLP